jgi:hypothetical protein
VLTFSPARRCGVLRPWPGILCVFVAVFATVVLQSCIVVPNLKLIKGIEDIARITIGESSRDEVITMLGHPVVFLYWIVPKSCGFPVVIVDQGLRFTATTSMI